MKERGGAARLSPLVLLLSIIPAFAIFFRVTGYDFVLLDDGVNIYENPLLGAPLLENTVALWKTSYEHLYIPLTYTVWQGVALISEGLRPGYFHSANLFIHLANTLILLALLYRVEKNSAPSVDERGDREVKNAKAGAIMGALLFSLHPLQVESVCWATEMKGLLSTLFSFLSIHLYLSFFSNQKKKLRYIFYLTSLSTFSLALLSKPSSVMLPLILFIIVPLISGGRRENFTPLIPWMLISVPFIVATKMAQPDLELEFVPPWHLRPLVAIDALSFYTYKLFFPFNLGVDYGRSPEQVLQRLQISVYWILPAVACLLLSLKRDKTPFFKYLIVAVLALIPVLGFVTFLFQKISTVSDHYFYMAMLGPALMFSRLSALNWDKPAWKVVLLLTLTAMAVQTFRQVGHWRDSPSLFKQAIEINPGSKIGHTNLGKYYFLKGNFRKARFHYQNMVSYYPKSPMHLSNLASSYFALGRLFQSEETFKRALKQDPDFFVAHQNLSKIFEKQRKYKEALFYANESLRIKPHDQKIIDRISHLLLLQQGGGY